MLDSAVRQGLGTPTRARERLLYDQLESPPQQAVAEDEVLASLGRALSQRVSAATARTQARLREFAPDSALRADLEAWMTEVRRQKVESNTPS
jgi:hypothetical protein